MDNGGGIDVVDEELDVLNDESRFWADDLRRMVGRCCSLLCCSEIFAMIRERPYPRYYND